MTLQSWSCKWKVIFHKHQDPKLIYSVETNRLHNKKKVISLLANLFLTYLPKCFLKTSTNTFSAQKVFFARTIHSFGSGNFKHLWTNTFLKSDYGKKHIQLSFIFLAISQLWWRKFHAKIYVMLTFFYLFSARCIRLQSSYVSIGQGNTILHFGSCRCITMLWQIYLPSFKSWANENRANVFKKFSHKETQVSQNIHIYIV